MTNESLKQGATTVRELLKLQVVRWLVIRESLRKKEWFGFDVRSAEDVSDQGVIDRQTQVAEEEHKKVPMVQTAQEKHTEVLIV